MTMPVIIKLDIRDTDMSKLREAIQACQEGKLVVFPTETVYGIGSKMSATGIDQRIRAVKGRSDHKPFAFHIGDWSMIDMLNVELTPVFRFFARHFWPGPVTFLVKNRSGEKIGIRFPKNKIACSLIAGVGEPLIATSANKSGQPSPHAAKQASEQLENSFDILIDGGRTEFAQDSTVVDLGEKQPVVLRKGAQALEVEKAVERVSAGKFPQKKVLVICTGNSCRSPMAEGWLKLELEKRGLSVQIEVSSCGMGTREGIPASVEAEFVMKNHGIDISRHKSRQCHKSDIWGADLILAMVDHHAQSINEIMSGAKSKIIVLNIEDPIGFGINVYESTFSQIERKLKEHFNEITRIP